MFTVFGENGETAEHFLTSSVSQFIKKYIKFIHFQGCLFIKKVRENYSNDTNHRSKTSKVVHININNDCLSLFIRYSKLYLKAELSIPKIEECKEFKQVLKMLLFLVDHTTNLKLSPQVLYMYHSLL